MAAPAFRAAGAIAASLTGITPGAPAGLATDDVELLFCETDNQALTLATANNFVEVTNIGVGTTPTATRLTVFWRRWNGTDGDPITNDSGDHQTGRRIAYSGCITTGNPWDVFGSNTQAATTAGSASSVTTTVADTLIVIAGTGDLPDATGTTEYSGWTNANLTSLTERIDNTRASGNGGALGVADGSIAAIGAIGATTYTTVTTAQKANVVIALKGPAAGAVEFVIWIQND